MLTRTIQRRRIKLRFIEWFLHLFEAQPAKLAHRDSKSETGAKIVELARSKIGYSPKTCDCDIYCSMMRFYKQNKQNTIG